jgi:predicted methyltransferase MtxX (methanogen marker protein 4)
VVVTEVIHLKEFKIEHMAKALIKIPMRILSCGGLEKLGRIQVIDKPQE